jgi:hypothetical protein
MVMWEIASRSIPYAGANPDVIRICVVEGQREEMVEGCPIGYTQLIQQCWDKDPSKRPQIDQVLAEIAIIKNSVKVCSTLYFVTLCYSFFKLIFQNPGSIFNEYYKYPFHYL